ncbi:MAG: PQQ-binding-like beta-propeller repeat protein [Candidatus Micrarchaeota archaeon]|nr:PQQ-binding-like beta-propeller repeat protein [Candidatus Micrarchaeota archaeon]
MKGIVFTMDAIFALVIAIVGISVLLLFNYYSPTAYSLHYSNAQAILANLAGTTVDSVRNSSVLAASLYNQYLGMNETWPLFLGGVRENSSNPIGPSEPILVSSFSPGNTITTGVVAAYGNIYFAANSVLYAVNATTNTRAWAINTINNVGSTPAAYSGMIYFMNATNLTAVNAGTGARVWSTNSVSGISPDTAMMAYNNEVIFGGSDNKVHSYYSTNGTSYWSYSLAAAPVSITGAGGSLVVKTSSNAVNVIVRAGTASASLTSTAYSGSAPTRSASEQSTYYLGTGANANAIYTNGTVVPGFPVGTTSAVTGAAVYKNYSVYQTTAGVAAISPSGNAYWSVAVPAYFGANVVNATPVVTSTMVYTLWQDGLAGENLSTGTIKWFASLHGATIYPYMTLAYGKLFVIANNQVLAYGSCFSPPHTTLLAAAATMFLNGQAGCGKALLNSVYPAANYTLFAGSISTNTLSVAHFNGAKGFDIARNSGPLNTTLASVSFWMNVSSYPSSGSRVVSYGDNGGGCASPTTNCGWFFEISSSGVLLFNASIGGTVTSSPGYTLSTGRWYFVTGSYNGSDVNLYINANIPLSTGISGSLSYATPKINLTVGGGLPTDSRYFTGNVADLQVYNTALSRQQIFTLYRNGPGGVPVSGAGLVAWYPLSGSTNDYADFNTAFQVGSAGFVNVAYTAPSLSNAYEISKASTLLPVLNYATGSSNTISVGVYSWS